VIIVDDYSSSAGDRTPPDSPQYSPAISEQAIPMPAPEPSPAAAIPLPPPPEKAIPLPAPEEFGQKGQNHHLLKKVEKEEESMEAEGEQREPEKEEKIITNGVDPLDKPEETGWCFFVSLEENRKIYR
jgi:hypothetical protein